MAKMQKRKLSKKEEKAAKKSDGAMVSRVQEYTTREPKIEIATKKQIALPEIVTVKDFADRANLPVTQVISTLMKSGILATINQTIDFETASIIGDDLGLEIIKEESTTKKVSQEITPESTNLVSRPPVVTIMGHVDHGKTTLLDNIRESSVVESESGGITQHITAYQVTLTEAKHKDLRGRKITFIDTPGHAAFSKMREHGTTITDIVVLIVAADDGVMPQTIEVILQAKANNVPIIVAINKVDLPDADVMKTKQQLSEYELIPEEWGGKTVMVEISAKVGTGINDLLEMILLQADLLELKADPDTRAVGAVIESRMEKGTGNTASVLIENGTLRVSDPVAIGSSYGRIRIMKNYANKRIDSAGPSTPVRIAGLKSLPNFGDKMIAFSNEKEAKIAAQRAEEVKSTLHIATARRIGEPEDGQRKQIDFNIIIKSDAIGSLEAIKKLISEIDSQEISIKVISEGVGTISESDITLAKATKSKVYGFRVGVLMAASKIAEKEGIPVKSFDVIYKLIDNIKVEVSALLPPEIIEDELGKLKVLTIFRDDKKAFVAGGKIESGHIALNDTVKVFQNGNEKYRDKINSIRQGKNEVKECDAGIECGIALTSGANIVAGDTIVAYHRSENIRTIK